jgi:hypothetical protein
MVKKAKDDALPGTEVERYEVVEIHRSELKDAPYNPRYLSDAARDKLRAGIKKIGLLAPPVWNARTGHIVSGHQRLSIMDSLKGKADYTLRVAKVDLDETSEKEANLLMNNPEAMGEWDLEKLEAMLSTEGLDLDATGFDVGDVYRMFGTAPMKAEQVDELSTRLQEAQLAFEESTQEAPENGPTEFYSVIVFRDAKDRDDFHATLKLPDNRYQDGRLLRKLFAATGMSPDIEQLPDATNLTPEENAVLRTNTRRELQKFRELARHLLQGKLCFFCKRPLLRDEVFADHKAGESRGKPLPDISFVTEHHIDGNHDNDAIENRTLCHDACHRGYHNKQRHVKPAAAPENPASAPAKSAPGRARGRTSDA